MTKLRLATVVLLTGAVAFGIAAPWVDPAGESASGGEIAVTLDGRPWKVVSDAQLAALPQERFVDPDGREQSGPLLAEALFALGVRRAKKVEATDFAGMVAMVGAATLEDRAGGPILALAGGAGVQLVGRSGDLRGPDRRLGSLERIDVFAPALDPAAARELAARPRRTDANELLDAGVVEVVAGKRRERVPYDRIRALATGSAVRKGREVAVAPIASVLASLSFPTGTRLRLYGLESEDIVEWGRSGKVEDFGIGFNREGKPKFMCTRPEEAAAADPNELRGPESRAARRALRQAIRHAPSEVKRLYRIEVIG